MSLRFLSVFIFACYAGAIALLSTSFVVVAYGDTPPREDDWDQTRDDVTGTIIMTRELLLHPKDEPSPALKYRFLPDDFDMLEGNAALYYLKAMGFLEQTNAREKLNELFRKAREQAQSKEISIDKVPPYSYLDTAPNQLPVKEVKEYLNLTQFQTSYLEEARKLRSFTSDRNLRQKENPIGYLLPEIQSMRELARTQSIRCRLAIAENRIDDAIQITGQQIALAKHLGHDDFYVSILVGIAIHSICWNDALYLIQHADTPNLYWAYASLPSPLIDIKKAGSFERQFLFEQVKCLREVNEEPKSIDFWQSFIKRFAIQSQGLEFGGFHFTNDAETNRLKTIAFVAAAYPGALRYLNEVVGMKSSTLESLPSAQVVFLAMVRFYERIRDAYFKWDNLPVAVAIQGLQREDSKLRSETENIGFAGGMVETFLPAMGAIRMAQGRLYQTIALIQTIEAIRMFASKNGGALPSSLADTPVPCPNDPVTDKPFAYELSGTTAVLSSSTANHMRYRFVIRVSK